MDKVTVLNKADWKPAVGFLRSCSDDTLKDRLLCAQQLEAKGYISGASYIRGLSDDEFEDFLVNLVFP